MRRMQGYLRRAIAPIHPYIHDLLVYMRILRVEGADNRILRRLAQPQPVEDLVGLLVEHSAPLHLEEVDTVVVSDIHIGSKHSLAGALNIALSRFSFKRLVLNGDIFDHLDFTEEDIAWALNPQAPLRGKFDPTHAELLRTLHTLSRTHEVVWIRGNHDDALSEHMAHTLPTVHHEYRWEFNGKNYLAIHGDQFDKLSQERPKLYAFGTKFFYFLQSLGPWTRSFCTLLKQKTKLYTKALNLVTDGALSHGAAQSADYVLCGHTHHVRHDHKNGVHYYNSGSWTETFGHLITISTVGIHVHTFSTEGEHIGTLSSAHA